MSASSVAPPPQSSNPSDQYHSAPSDPQSPSELAEAAHRFQRQRDYESFKHYSALGMLFLAPTLILMPPRKLDLYTMALSAGFVVSASQLSRERYGAGLLDLAARNYAARMAGGANTEQKAMQQAGEGEIMGGKWGFPTTTTTGNVAIPTGRAREVQEQIRRSKETGTPLLQDSNSIDETDLSTATTKTNSNKKEPGILTRLWLGDEKPGWKDRRAQAEKEALERGEGYGDLIRRQISEIWGTEEKKAEELREEDERVVREQKREK